MEHHDVLILYAENAIDEEELAICMIPSYESRLLPRRSLDLINMTGRQCLKNFRFELDDLQRLTSVLLFPETVVLENRMRVTGLETMCVVLRRLAYPCRLHDLEELFGKTEDVLSRMFNFALYHIHNRFGHLLDTLGHTWMDKDTLKRHSSAVTAHGSPYNGVILFTDGTVNGICRPSLFQHIVYNGYKKKHALKYQSSLSINGLVAHFVGPVVGIRHDNRIFSESNLSAEIKKKATEHECSFYAYGDQGYRTTPYILAPFRTGRDEIEDAINKAMVPLRISVEWTFGKITTLFAFLEFPKNQKIYLQPVGLYYRTAVLFTNAHTCLYGSSTGTYFGVEPPSLESYFLG